MQRVPIADLTAAIERALLNLGIAPERAALSARLTAETDCDGVRTHGIARLPRFAQMVHNGAINPLAEPTCVTTFGAIERWSGHRGPGNLAAHACMARAIQLAQTKGIGAVALADTSHWQRGGTYGWQAAEANCAALCWTNTLPNLPPWGATSPALGNNPLILAIPNQQNPAALSHGHIVLDIAMSQFSYGSLDAYRNRNEQLPIPGGFDEHNHLTTDPATIERTQRALPIGFWKGSGLSFALDVLAAMLSGGRTTSELTTDPVHETGLSQIFIAIAPTSIATIEDLTRTTHNAIDFLHAATPIDPTHPPRYPGENTQRLRAENLAQGIPVDEAQYKAVIALAK